MLLRLTAPGILTHALSLISSSVRFLKAPQAVTATQVVLTAMVVRTVGTELANIPGTREKKMNITN